MLTRSMDPGVKRARAEDKEFLRKMAGFSNGRRLMIIIGTDRPIGSR